MGRDFSRIELSKYIRASADQVWRALIDPVATRKYFMAHGAIHGTLEPGSSLEYIGADESGAPTVLVRGTVRDCQPGRALSHSFALPGVDEPESRVTWSIAPFGRSHTKLVLVHDQLLPATHERMKNAWGPMLVRLQTLLENGATGWQ